LLLCQAKDTEIVRGFAPHFLLFVYIANIMQSHVVRQMPKVFYKSAYFFAKQSQFLKKSNGYKVKYIKGL